MSKTYICDCGRIFEKPNSFNGHKSHCIVHLEKTGRLSLRLQVDINKRDKTSKTLLHNAQLKKEAENQKWIDEKHTCETCGKVMTEKFGSGRFCSHSCANTRPLMHETIEKIRNSITHKNQCKDCSSRFKEKYYESPKKCCICSSYLTYEQRSRKTCSRECFLQLLSNKCRDSVVRNGGNNNSHGVRGTAHYGTYKGFHCDSSYELAVVMYCLDHNIPITRNTQGFDYVFNDIGSKYYPDFIIDGVYVETKNYWTEQVQAKIDQFPKELKYIVVYYDDIKPCIDYCIKTYGKNFTTMYDSNLPSWMNKTTQ